MSEPNDPTVQPIELRTSDDSGFTATAFSRPSLSWKLRSTRNAVVQRAYELQVAPDRAFGQAVRSSGRIETGLPIGAPWPGRALASREVAWCRIRVWTDRGLTGWSEALRVEASLFRDDDWVARPISPVFNVGQREPGPVPLLRRQFSIDHPVNSARLYISAFGIHRTWLNGHEVSRDLLEPGWTAYRDRLLFAALDVSGQLRPGANVLAAAIGDGWWRGNLTWEARRGVYGDTTALLAQLEVLFADGSRQIVATDDSWRAATGGLIEADIYNGSKFDMAREPAGWREPGFDDSGWSGVTALPLPRGLEQRSMPPVRVVETLEPASNACGDVIALDAGQNLSGHVRLTVKAERPTTISVRHAEVLDPNGRLFTAPLRTAKATDEYRVGAGHHVLEPHFTYHGFRYAEVAGEGIAIERAEVCAISQDLVRTGHFACSEPLLNRLHENIVWSQRSNFVTLPTDCPQRDERLGWTGDIQVFAPTACANFDSRAFLASWLRDLALEQAADGQVPSVVPNVIQGHPYEFGGIGWADAATLIPWTLYEAYGDRDMLQRQLPSMQRWVDWAASRRDDQGVWRGDFQLGDWLDPGAPADKPEQATTDRDFIASAYLARSASALADSMTALGDDRAARYADLSQAVAGATWRIWQSSAVLTQTGCALAIAFGIAPEADRRRVGQALAGLVGRTGGRIGTGFLGTPLVLPALTASGQHAAAYRLLLNREAPGWLYQVLMGATTSWERWDAIRPDGSIHGGEMAIEDAESMTSFNHYAYGSVGAWLYRSLAGIAPAAPGYSEIAFSPQPGGGLTWAEARIETPFGLAAIRWQLAGDALDVRLTVPAGARAGFAEPPGWRLCVECDASLGSGTHHLQLVSD